MNKNFIIPPEIPGIPEYEVLADKFYDRIMNFIQKAVISLQDDEDYQVLYYDRAGQPYTVANIGYANPHLIVLKCLKPGMSNDVYYILVHMQSVELIFNIVKKEHQEKTKNPIGFLGDMNMVE